MDGEQRDLTAEENDLQERSTKKVKGGDQSFPNNSSIPVNYADISTDLQVKELTVHSYKDFVLGHDHDAPKVDGEGSSDMDPDFSLSTMKLSIIEKKYGGYDCPEFVIPPLAEARVCRPWRKGLIVKLLGRKIGFKALENQLQQMWVRKGALSLVDFGNDYFLVYLSREEDQSKDLTDGPWLIYDHYLTVREWSPNFWPERGTIDRVAIW